jgi:hypothetical protein
MSRGTLHILIPRHSVPEAQRRAEDSETILRDWSVDIWITWVERAQIFRQSVGQHGNAVLNQVGARRSCLCFCIKGRVGVHKERDIGNVYSHFPSRVCGRGACFSGYTHAGVRFCLDTRNTQSKACDSGRESDVSPVLRMCRASSRSFAVAGSIVQTRYPTLRSFLFAISSAGICQESEGTHCSTSPSKGLVSTPFCSSSPLVSASTSPARPSTLHKQARLSITVTCTASLLSTLECASCAG